MKIVIFKGGIGNQLFQYQLYRYLESKGNLVYYKDRSNKYMSHNGLELNKYFCVNIKPIPKWLDVFFTFGNKILIRLVNSLYATEDVFKENALWYNGYWQDNRYCTENVSFRNLTLSNRNQKVVEQIKNNNSVFIHVRRGDYLQPNTAKRYGGICTIDYYNNAILVIQNEMTEPRFFVFSDDIEWCRNNLSIPSAQFIDWNKGDDSIWDMYLMSYCKGGIIANSTFSYWGARVGENKIVVYPKKWFADKPAPNIFLSNWIGL